MTSTVRFHGKIHNFSLPTIHNYLGKVQSDSIQLHWKLLVTSANTNNRLFPTVLEDRVAVLCVLCVHREIKTHCAWTTLNKIKLVVGDSHLGNI